MDLPEIQPGRLYSLAEAATLVPSCRPGKHVRAETLHQWRRDGRLKCIPRPAGKLTWWFVWGAELLRAIGVDNPPEWHGRTAAQRQRDYEAALESLRARGVVAYEDPKIG